MLVREQYLNKLIDFKDINLIKVITGVRRCGKSTLLLQFKDYLINNKVKLNNILYMNFESIEWADIDTYKKLADYVHRIYEKKNKGKLYILLDEIQMVDKWEKAVNSFLVDLDCDIYITGSNAYLLSSELTTLLAGRVLTLSVYPFSFKEFMQIYPFTKDTNDYEKFDIYLKYGGMPMISNFNDQKELIFSYLNDIRDVVVKNDIITRNNIKDVALLDNLIKYLSSVIGSFTNPSAIATYLNNNGSKTRNETIDNYLNMIENAYLFYLVPRYSVNGKMLLKTNGKYYMVDTGIRNAISNFVNYDSGIVIENVVYMELRRRGYQVYVGQYENLEIDFVAIKLDETKYYQVTKTMIDENTEKREKKSLLAINDNYPKYIITMDMVKDKVIEGIKVVNIIDFLLNENL